MIKLCLMASHGYPPGLILHNGQELSRVVKDCRPYLGSFAARDMSPVLPNQRLNGYDGSWRAVNLLPESDRLVGSDSCLREPVIIDARDGRPDSLLFSFRIAQQCAKQEEVLKFLTSGSTELEKRGPAFSLLTELASLQHPSVDLRHEAHENPLIYLDSKSENPIVDFVADMARSSRITFQPNGHVLFTGTKSELNDWLSVVAEFYLARNSGRWRKLACLVPQFRRYEDVCTAAVVSPPKIEGVTLAPLKSHEKVKHKPSSKRKGSRKWAPERDLYKRNYFHACESLLSLMINKNHQRSQNSIYTLKRSGPELPELLTQLSAGIAGTALTVLFSVICNVASSGIPPGTARLLDTGLGIGLVWLSWAVNVLRDTILNARKNVCKPSLREDELIRKVERSISEVYLRAATVLAVVVFRFAL